MPSSPGLTPDEKLEIVLSLLQQDATVEEVAARYKVAETSLASWRTAVLAAGRSALDANRRKWRAPAAAGIGLLVGAYLVAIVLGRIPQTSKINAVDVGILALAIVCVMALLSPQLVDRFKLFQFGNFRLELLEQVKEKQVQQEGQLELILPLLLPESERAHLVNLENGWTRHYIGTRVLRDQLRRLRSGGLITMRPGHTVGQMGDRVSFDLGEYVELTESGRRWLDRIRQNLPEGQRRLLTTIAEGTAGGMRTSDALRGDLRALRSGGLLSMRPGHTVAGLPDGEDFDLTTFVQLTESGQRWSERFRTASKETGQSP